MLVPSNSIIGQPAIIGASNALMYNPTTHTQAGIYIFFTNIIHNIPNTIVLLNKKEKHIQRYEKLIVR